MRYIIDLEEDNVDVIYIDVPKTKVKYRIVKPTKVDNIINRIEQVRDMDKNAGEYPYNRCIKIIREVLGDD